MADESPLKTFDQIQGEEWKEILKRRAYVYASPLPDETTKTSKSFPESEKNLVGLALSGGGIRSATFNLGVLQAFAELGILPLFDYLSTVSGGGYIGCWLAAWIKREGKLSVVEDQLKSKRNSTDSKKTEGEPEAIHHLRAYSNYLTPRTGLFSSDTWAVVATYLRNLTANLLVLLPFLTFILCCLRCLFLRYQDAIDGARLYLTPIWRDYSPWDLSIPFSLILYFLIRNENNHYNVLYSDLTNENQVSEARSARRFRQWKKWYLFGLSLLGIAVVHLSLVPKFLSIIPLDYVRYPEAIMIVLPTLTVISLVTVVFVGSAVFSRGLNIQVREFISRGTGCLLCGAIVWFLITTASLYGHLLFSSGLAATLTVGGWSVPTIYSVLKGFGTSTGQDERRWERFAIFLGPPVFLLGIFCGLSWLVSAIVHAYPLALVLLTLGCLTILVFSHFFFDINRCSLTEMYGNRLIRCYLGAPRKKWNSRGVTQRVEGPPRLPNPITGFDVRDDLPLSTFRIGESSIIHAGGEVLDGEHDWKSPYWGPYPLVNAAINLVGGDELAFQERRADSFLLSPLFCGARDVRYRATGDYGRSIDDLTLGHAMAISGACANPNMGYHSSPMLTALMTVFNARLGWWFANPRYPAAWKDAEPRFGAMFLLRELFGWTNAETDYVNLSDGGHFENMGVYELIRRRCRFIVVSDAGADPDSQFADLGNLTRKCKTDFGISIEINVDQLKPQGDERLCKWHCVIGVIRYDLVDARAPVGMLVCIKPTFTGDEPADVKEYRTANPAFPQEPTYDQFFGESQFESYRGLGHHIAMRVFEKSAEKQNLLARFGFRAREKFLPCQMGASSATNDVGIRQHIRLTNGLFSELLRQWTTPPPPMEKEFLSTVDEYLRLLGDLQDNPKLQRFRNCLYPELNGKPTPQEYNELHATSHMLQVMENSWLKLNLDEYHNHPRNSGWKNVFYRWSRSPILRKYWPMLRVEYSRDFVEFCEQQLGFRMRTEFIPISRLSSKRPGFQQLVTEYSQEWPEESESGQRGLDHFYERAKKLADRHRREENAEEDFIWAMCVRSECDDGQRATDQARDSNYSYVVGVAALTEVEEQLTDALSPTPIRRFELLIWVRPAYRSSELGTVLLQFAMSKARNLKVKTWVDREFRVEVRCPRSAWRGAGGGLAKQSWFMLFVEYGFRQPAQIDVENAFKEILPTHEVLVLSSDMLETYFDEQKPNWDSQDEGDKKPKSNRGRTRRT